MVFDEITNDDFILLSKQGRSQLIYSTELTAEHVFEIFWGELPGFFHSERSSYTNRTIN